MRAMRKTNKARPVGHVQQIIDTYGRSTNKYRIRVMGDFPLTDNEPEFYSNGKLKRKKMTEEVHEHKGLPVEGYKATQSKANVDLVNEGKQIEERVLRYIEKVQAFNIERSGGDPRMSVIGRTQIQLGFMAVFRSVFEPQRISLPEDFI